MNNAMYVDQLLKDRTRSIRSWVNVYKFSNSNQLLNLANDYLWYYSGIKKALLLKDFFLEKVNKIRDI